MNEEVGMERGQVWYVGFDNSIGHEEAVGRPAIIVSSDQGIERSPVVIVVYTTTQVRTLGVTVELSSMRKRSWALCSNVTSVDKRRLRGYMCTLTDAEMAKVDLALREALGLPVKVEGLDFDAVEKLEKNVSELETALELVKDRAAELESDVAIYKRLYDKLLEKYIDLKFEKDTSVSTPVERTVVYEDFEPPLDDEEPPVPEEPELDLSALQEKFNVYDERLKKQQVKEKVDGRTLRRGQPKFGEWFSGEKVNVNTATVDELVEKAGIGRFTAMAIRAYRNKNGAFKDLSDLCNVERFGPRCFDKYIERLEV